ncbi:MAG: radical SAM protein [Chitinophagales bacterium]
MLYQIELTNVCNSACPWCPHREMQRPQGFMSRAVFEALLQTVPREGIAGGQLGLHHFGEPLLHPDLPYFLRRLAEEGIGWRLSSNGRLLARPDIRRTLLESRGGELYLSMENGARVADVQALLTEKQATGSPLAVVLQTLSAFDADYERYFGLTGDFQTYTQMEHTWARAGDGWKSEDCPFLVNDWVVVLWDGTYVSCCADYEGRSALGRVGAGRARNRRWQACATCDVARAFFEPPRGLEPQRRPERR